MRFIKIIKTIFILLILCNNSFARIVEEIIEVPVSVINNNFINSPFESDQKYDAIIVAVAHNEFLNYTIADFNQLTKGKLVLLDLKGIYEKSTWKL